MLVLSRRRDEAIHIGSDIKVTVLSIRNLRVKLGIEAPNGVSIWREELVKGVPRLLEDGPMEDKAAKNTTLI